MWSFPACPGSGMERVRLDVIHFPVLPSPSAGQACARGTRDDVGARAANGGDKVLWECIGPYEAEVRYALRISRRNPTKWLRRDKEERGSENGTQRARSDVVYSALQLGKIPEAQKFRNFRRNCHHAERKTGT